MYISYIRGKKYCGMKAPLGLLHNEWGEARMLRAVWFKSCNQHLIKQLLYGCFIPISQTIQVR